MSNDDRQERPAKRPSHIAYSVREGSDGNAYFNRVGSAFAHKDGQGFNVELEATPVNGRVTLRTPKERLEEKRSGSPGRRQSRDYERDS